MVWSIVAGGVIYNEFAEFDDCTQSVCVGGVSLAWIFFPLGVAVTIFGVVMQSRGGHSGAHGGGHSAKAVTSGSDVLPDGRRAGSGEGGGLRKSLLSEVGGGVVDPEAERAYDTFGGELDAGGGGGGGSLKTEWGFALPELEPSARRLLDSCSAYQDVTITLSPPPPSSSSLDDALSGGDGHVGGDDGVPFLGVEFGTDIVVALDTTHPTNQPIHVFQVRVAECVCVCVCS